MAQYEVEAPLDRNVALRGGGRHYVFLKGTKQTVEASGDIAGLIEAHGCKVTHVGDEPDAYATFHAEKVAASQDAENQVVGVQAKSQEAEAGAVEEEGGEVSDLKALCEASGVVTQASSAAGLKRALTAAGVDWRTAILDDSLGGEEE